jgi:DNA-binding CsgD family transcriptional regulator
MGRRSTGDSTDKRLLEVSVLHQHDLAKTMLNSLPANSAILDERGVIRMTNAAWQDFGRRYELRCSPDCVGFNYVELAACAHGYSAEKAQDISTGIRALLRGNSDEFDAVYPCHSHGEERWFRLRAARLPWPGSLRVIVTHEDMTQLKRAQSVLRDRESQLEYEKRNLETVNIALKVLLEHREKDKRELEERVILNVKNRVLPCIDELRKSRLTTHQTQCIKALEENLNDIVSPMSYQLHSRYYNLTNQEIQVATMVIDGKTTKQMAEILCISSNAVEFHRKNIRRKLGIRNKKVNLRARLLSLI